MNELGQDLTGIKSRSLRMTRYVELIGEALRAKTPLNKTKLEKMAATFRITDKNEVKELTELAIVYISRELAQGEGSVWDKYFRIVDFYKHQVNLSHRTSMSVMLQQYSTPAPVAYLAGVFVKADQGVSVVEPSAGNGLLTIAAKPSNVVVNEVDDFRRANLEKQGYKQVLKQDATEPFTTFAKKFDAVLTNPPFGRLDTPVKYDTFPIRTLDHLMALRALDTMKDEGRAAIIIGNHTRWDRKGRIQAGKNRIFFNYLHSRYHVLDAINIDGKLYSRQGTSFNVRLILVDGRKTTFQGAAPLEDKDHDKVVRNFKDVI